MHRDCICSRFQNKRLNTCPFVDLMDTLPPLTEHTPTAQPKEKAKPQKKKSQFPSRSLTHCVCLANAPRTHWLMKRQLARGLSQADVESSLFWFFLDLWLVLALDRCVF